MPWTASQQFALAVIPKVSSLLSLFGSVWIAVEVWTGETKNSQGQVIRKRHHPYHRLLLAMSLYDGLESVWNFTSTWPIPAHTENLWHPRGNTHTCSAQGYFLTLSVAVPIYNAMLSIYYVLVINYGFRDVTLRQWVEPLMHFVAGFWAFGTATTAAFMGLFNNANLWCWIAPYPSGCLDSFRHGRENATCERGDNAFIFQWTFYFAPLWLCILFSTVATLMVYWKVRHHDRTSLQYRKPETRLSVVADVLHRRSNALILQPNDNNTTVPRLTDTNQYESPPASSSEARRRTFRQSQQQQHQGSMVILEEDEEELEFDEDEQGMIQYTQNVKHQSRTSPRERISCEEEDEDGTEDLARRLHHRLVGSIRSSGTRGGDLLGSPTTMNSSSPIAKWEDHSEDNSAGVVEIQFETNEEHVKSEEIMEYQSPSTQGRQRRRQQQRGMSSSTRLSSNSISNFLPDLSSSSFRFPTNAPRHLRSSMRASLAVPHQQFQSWCERRQTWAESNPRTSGVFQQAVWYLGVFYLTHAWSTTNRILQFIRQGNTKFGIIVLHSWFDPFQGFLNFLVYQRPQYKKIRQESPQLTAWQATRRTLEWSFQAKRRQQQERRLRQLAHEETTASMPLFTSNSVLSARSLSGGSGMFLQRLTTTNSSSNMNNPITALSRASSEPGGDQSSSFFFQPPPPTTSTTTAMEEEVEVVVETPTTTSIGVQPVLVLEAADQVTAVDFSSQPVNVANDASHNADCPEDDNTAIDETVAVKSDRFASDARTLSTATNTSSESGLTVGTASLMFVKNGTDTATNNSVALGNDDGDCSDQNNNEDNGDDSDH